jgi:hypothetical protein
VENNLKANLFIVGAMKAGTTSLTKLLEQHPDIFVCPVKEPNFFISELPALLIDKEDYSDIKTFLDQLNINSRKHFAHVKTLDEYHSLFRFYNKEKYLADCSTLYLHSEEAAKKIKEYNPDAKIIILLRDPIRRAFSHYKMDYAKGRTNKTFEEAWQLSYKQKADCWGYYKMSLYTEPIKNYQQLFGNENVKILSFENIISNKNELIKLEDLLKIDFKNMALLKENESIKPKSPLLNALIYKYNIKNVIRKLTPPLLLEKGKKVFYTNNNLSLADKTYNNLIPFFENDVKECEKLLGYSLNYLKPLS